MRINAKASLFLGITLLAGSAGAVPVTLTKLTGLTGDAGAAATAVYKADLSSSGLPAVQSVTILDNSAGLGGSPGQFTAFDLDAVVLSTTDCADAACAKTMPVLAVFNYGAGIFTPGTQRAPVDPKLFGTGPGGNTVDDLVARLGLFDGFSSTVTPDGFLSMGDGGILSLNLTSGTSTSGLFLYIGEVGDNGEVAASEIQIRDTLVPAPGTLALMGLALLGLARARRT
jgi:hypothetical protein